MTTMTTKYIGAFVAGSAAAALFAAAFLTSPATAQQEGRRLEEERRYDKSSAVLSPPRTQDQAAVSAQQAAETARQHNGRPISRSGAVRDVALVRFSDNEMRAPSTAPGEPGALILQDVLAWAIITPDVPQMLYGGMDTTDEQRVEAAKVSCDYVQIVDAASGDYLESFQAC